MVIKVQGLELGINYQGNLRGDGRSYIMIAVVVTLTNTFVEIYQIVLVSGEFYFL